jgi:phosphohistidine phosphatase
MHLYIARHAWAGHFGDPGWPDDSLRELTPEGIERYERVVERLAERGVAPQRIATSPYARCVQTAEILASGLANQPPVEEVEALAPGSELQELLAWSDLHAPDDIAWVGHNPDVERLVGLLIADRGAWVRFAKGSIAAIRFEENVRRGEGVLEWHATAKLLGV